MFLLEGKKNLRKGLCITIEDLHVPKKFLSWNFLILLLSDDAFP